MKLNSAQLEAFVAVARHLNFTRAAEDLFVTQSALSQRIAKLEEEMETTLFVRDRANLRLTEAGHRVLRFCQLSHAAEDDLLNDLKSSDRELAGTLRIGGFSSVNRSLLIPALQSLFLHHPKLSLRLQTHEVGELHETLRRGEVDYIVTTIKSEDLECVFLGYEENVRVISKKHASARGIFLDHDEEDATTKNYFRQTGGDIPAKRRYLDDVYGLMDGVRLGYGEAILPLHLIATEKDLRVVDPRKILKVPVYLCFFKQPYYRKTHNVVVDAIHSQISSCLAQK